MRMNKVCLAGHLGIDPVFIPMPSGTPAVEFTLATDESYKDREGNKVSRTEWHRIKIYGRAAEYAFSHVYKGFHVYIEGSLRTRSWEDKETGRKRFITEVVVNGPRDSIQIIPGSRRAKQAEHDEQAPSAEDLGPAFPSADVPF